MGSTFKATVKVLLRTPMLFVWAFAFPILLATLFVLMFANIDELDEFEPVDVAVVADASFSGSPFSSVVEGLGAEGDGQMLSVREAADEQEALALIAAGEVAGAFAVDAEGSLRVLLPSEARGSTASRAQIDATILEAVADSYARSQALIEQVARENPQALSDPVQLATALDVPAATEEVQLTYREPRQTVRYYFALLGMAVLFTSNVAMVAVCLAQPNLSPIGARRALGAESRGRVLAGTLLASWALTFAFLAVAFAYIRFALGIDFGGRDALDVAGIAAASLFSTAFGTLVGAVPKLSLGAKTGLLVGATCVASLFGGLYGQPCMELADLIAREAPALAALNPAKLVSDLFYSLYSYESLDAFVQCVALLVALAAACGALAALLVRRQRYEHL